MEQDRKIAQVGRDCHRRFSQVALRNGSGAIVERRRIEHADRERMRETLRSWPRGTPVTLEGTFGWGWVSDPEEDSPQRTQRTQRNTTGQEARAPSTPSSSVRSLRSLRSLR